RSTVRTLSRGRFIHGNDHRTDGNLVALLDANARDCSSDTRRNGSYGFAGFQFDQILTFLDLGTWLHQHADDRAAVSAFTEIGKLYVHKFRGGNVDWKLSI